jgi:uroporphyrinogen-III synthase
LGIIVTEELPFHGWSIAVPESRQLDVFCDMLEQRGAQAIRCPLVSIYDYPEQDKVLQWLHNFINGGFDDLIMLTGEGIRLLTACAERHACKDEWIATLAKVRKISRGPKPGRALSELGLKPNMLANAPTTEGIIDLLMSEDLASRKVAIQLYGEVANERLQDFLANKRAVISPV